jgi:hypothetical protein
MAREWIKHYRSMYDGKSTIADVVDECGVIAYAYWPAICMWASNDATPGAFKTTVRGMRRDLSDTKFTVGEVAQLVQALHNVRVIECCGDLDGEVWITIPRFADFQILSNADRKAIQRHEARLHPNRVALDSTGQKSLMADPSRGESRAEESRAEEKKREALLSDKPDDAPLDPDHDPAAANVRLVFEAWRKTFGKTSGTKLDPKRRTRIQWAIRTYGMAATGDCLRGYRADPWPDRLQHCDLTVLFRDAAHFEKGLELHETNTRRLEPHDPNRPEQVAAARPRSASLAEFD